MLGDDTRLAHDDPRSSSSSTAPYMPAGRPGRHRPAWPNHPGRTPAVNPRHPWAAGGTETSDAAMALIAVEQNWRKNVAPSAQAAVHIPGHLVEHRVQDGPSRHKLAGIA